MLEKPDGTILFVERRRRYADQFEKPATELRLVQMQPVKGTMDCGEGRKLHDALMGRGRHPFFEA